MTVPLKALRRGDEMENLKNVQSRVEIETLVLKVVRLLELAMDAQKEYIQKN